MKCKNCISCDCCKNEEYCTGDCGCNANQCQNREGEIFRLKFQNITLDQDKKEPIEVFDTDSSGRMNLKYVKGQINMYQMLMKSVGGNEELEYFQQEMEDYYRYRVTYDDKLINAWKKKYAKEENDRGDISLPEDDFLLNLDVSDVLSLEESKSYDEIYDNLQMNEKDKNLEALEESCYIFDNDCSNIMKYHIVSLFPQVASSDFRLSIMSMSHNVYNRRNIR